MFTEHGVRVAIVKEESMKKVAMPSMCYIVLKYVHKLKARDSYITKRILDVVQVRRTIRRLDCSGMPMQLTQPSPHILLHV